MSATLAGKFQDHYQVLEIDAKADSAVIERAFRELSARYDPANRETGDEAKYQAVTQAFEVLMDPDLRKAFDGLRAGPPSEAKPAFSGEAFFHAIQGENARRLAVLCILYDRRLKKPSAPGLSLRQLEGMIQTTPDQLQFAMWYLKQRGQVVSDDKSNVMITFPGIDYLETVKPDATLVLGVLKPGCVEGAAPEPAPAKAPEPISAAPGNPGPSPDLAALRAALEAPPKPVDGLEARPPETQGRPGPQISPKPAPALPPNPAAAPTPVHAHTAPHKAEPNHAAPRPASSPVRRVISIPARRAIPPSKPGEGA